MAKRILLKLSGEQLQGEFASGFDPARARWIAEQIKPALKTGAEVVIMVGGGNTPFAAPSATFKKTAWSSLPAVLAGPS